MKTCRSTKTPATASVGSSVVIFLIVDASKPFVEAFQGAAWPLSPPWLSDIGGEKEKQRCWEVIKSVGCGGVTS